MKITGSEALARRCTMSQSRPYDAPRAALRPLLRKRRILQVLQSAIQEDGAKSGAKKGPEKKRFRGLFRKLDFYIYDFFFFFFTGRARRASLGPIWGAQPELVPFLFISRPQSYGV